MAKFTDFKFVKTLFLELKNIGNDDETKYITFYSHSIAETVINEKDIDDIFESIYTTIISNIHKYLGRGSS